MSKSKASGRQRKQPDIRRQSQSRPWIITRRHVDWRVHQILELLKRGRPMNCRQLAEAIEGVSAKTIQRDIAHMQNSLGHPIEYDAQRHGFILTGPIEERPPLELNRGELVALFVARHALEPMRGTRLERLLAESFEKIAQACTGEVSIHWHELDAAFSVKAAGVVPADVLLFDHLLDAAKKRCEVSFAYRSLKQSKAERRQVQPHHVSHNESGWYLLGWDCDREAYRTFALQRIEDLTVLSKTFTRRSDFDARAMMSSGFGVWSYHGDGLKLHEVRVRLTDWAARVVAERHWHPTQEIETLAEDGSAIEFRAQVAGLEEMTRWVLSWGSKAEVLSPGELRDRVDAEVELLHRRRRA